MVVDFLANQWWGGNDPDEEERDQWGNLKNPAPAVNNRRSSGNRRSSRRETKRMGGKAIDRGLGGGRDTMGMDSLMAGMSAVDNPVLQALLGISRGGQAGMRAGAQGLSAGRSALEHIFGGGGGRKEPMRGIPSNANRTSERGMGRMSKGGGEMSAMDSAMQFLNGLGGGGGQSEADFAAAVAAEFDPQYKSLDDRSNFARSAIDSMYDSQTGGIKANDPVIAGIYDESIGRVKATGDQARAQTQGDYAETEANQNALLKRLGISEAQDDVAAIRDPNEAAALSNLTSNTTGTVNALEGGKTSQRGYNNAQLNVSDMESKAYQAQIYMNALAQRGELDSARAARMNEMRASAGESGMKPSDMIDMFQWGYEQDARAGREANDSLSPWDATANIAAERLNPEQAELAMSRLRQALLNGGDKINNADDLMRMMGELNRDRAIPYQILSSLASNYFTRADPRRGANVQQTEFFTP